MVKSKDFFEYKEIVHPLIFIVGFIVGYTAHYLYTPTNNTSNPVLNTIQSNLAIPSNNHSVVFPLVAVTSEGIGVLEYATLSYTKGNGNIYMNINPFVEPDTQYVLESAIKYVCSRFDFDCRNKNFYLSINSSAQLVGGPSAGLAFALATYYLLSGKEFPNNVAVTGAVDSSGKVYKVGGVFEKALAAAQAGKTIFIVPEGQSIVYNYEKVEKTRQIAPGVYVTQIYYKPVPFNLSNYFEQKYGMKIYEVSTVDEAINLLKKIKS